MIVAETREALRDALGDPRTSGSVVLVPTMGALHAGHLALLDIARAQGSRVVVSIFVNPLQFSPDEDLQRYPRPRDADLQLCREREVDIAFVPSFDVVYPSGEPLVKVEPGPLAGMLEGASRPGHFVGVLLVVAKLLGLVRPDKAVFGQKDYQQLVLVRQMVKDLCMPVEVLGAETVRDADGLALSSRNRYLTGAERVVALTLSRALDTARAAGPGGASAVLDTARAVIQSEPDVDLDYLVLRAVDLGEAPERGEARLLVAATIGTTRLVDNLAVKLGDETTRPVQ